MKFILLINLKILAFADFVLLNITERENFFANKYENANYSQIKFHAQLSWAWKKFYKLGARLIWSFLFRILLSDSILTLMNAIICKKHVPELWKKQILKQLYGTFLIHSSFNSLDIKKTVKLSLIT